MSSPWFSVLLKVSVSVCLEKQKPLYLSLIIHRIRDIHSCGMPEKRKAEAVPNLISLQNGSGGSQELVVELLQNSRSSTKCHMIVSDSCTEVRVSDSQEALSAMSAAFSTEVDTLQKLTLKYLQTSHLIPAHVSGCLCLHWIISSSLSFSKVHIGDC